MADKDVRDRQCGGRGISRLCFWGLGLAGVFPTALLRAAVRLNLGALVLLDALDADYPARLPDANHRAAASALSSGRELKAIAAPGAAL